MIALQPKKEKTVTGEIETWKVSRGHMPFWGKGGKHKDKRRPARVNEKRKRGE